MFYGGGGGVQNKNVGDASESCTIPREWVWEEDVPLSAPLETIFVCSQRG